PHKCASFKKKKWKNKKSHLLLQAAARHSLSRLKFVGPYSTPSTTPTVVARVSLPRVKPRFRCPHLTFVGFSRAVRGFRTIWVVTRCWIFPQSPRKCASFVRKGKKENFHLLLQAAARHTLPLASSSSALARRRPPPTVPLSMCRCREESPDFVVRTFRRLAAPSVGFALFGSSPPLNFSSTVSRRGLCAVLVAVVCNESWTLSLSLLRSTDRQSLSRRFSLAPP
ncbi:unnamed protein product, partial [Citrullus colocynthis]